MVQKQDMVHHFEEASPWRHLLEHTSQLDYWRLLLLFRQLDTKFGSWCTPHRQLAMWSTFGAPSESCAEGGLLGGVLRHALALLANPDSTGQLARLELVQRPAFVKRSARDEFLAFYNARQGGGGRLASQHPSYLPSASIVLPTVQQLLDAIALFCRHHAPCSAHPSGTDHVRPRRAKAAWQDEPHAQDDTDGPRGDALLPRALDVTAAQLMAHILEVVGATDKLGGVHGVEGDSCSPAAAICNGTLVMVVGQLQSRQGHLVLSDDTGEIGLVVPVDYLSAARAIGLMDVVVLTDWSVVLPCWRPRLPPSLEQAAREQDGLASLNQPYLQLSSACTAPSRSKVQGHRVSVDEGQDEGRDEGKDSMYTHEGLDSMLGPGSGVSETSCKSVSRLHCVLPQSLHRVLRRRAGVRAGEHASALGSALRASAPQDTSSAHRYAVPLPPLPLPTCGACVIRVDDVHVVARTKRATNNTTSVSAVATTNGVSAPAPGIRNCGAGTATDEMHETQARGARHPVSDAVCFTVTGMLLQLSEEAHTCGTQGGRQGAEESKAACQEAGKPAMHRTATSRKASIRFTGSAALHFPFVQVGTCLYLTSCHELLDQEGSTSTLPHLDQVLRARARSYRPRLPKLVCRGPSGRGRDRVRCAVSYEVEEDALSLQPCWVHVWPRPHVVCAGGRAFILSAAPWSGRGSAWHSTA
jgi:hypothetical protein